MLLNKIFHDLETLNIEMIFPFDLEIPVIEIRWIILSDPNRRMAIYSFKPKFKFK